AVPDIDPGDLARVEVLRGPQGTLYGADSMGGLIKFVTVDPSTDKVSGRLQVGTDTVQNGNGLGYNARGSVNLPVSDSLAVRMSGFTHHDPGYIDNPVYGQKGVNQQRTDGGHIAALWRASDAVSVRLSALCQSAESDGSDVVQALPGSAALQQAFLPGTG